MERLVLKIPVGKPPFVGVLFESEFAGAMTHTELVNSYNREFYEIKFEPSHKLKLCLKGFTLPPRIYELDYDPVKLLKFLQQTRDCKMFNFGHVIIVNDNYKIIRTAANQTNFVLKVNKLSVDLSEL